MSIADTVKLRDLEARIRKMEKWIEDFEQWPKPDPQLVEAAVAIACADTATAIKRGPGRPRKNKELADG